MSKERARLRAERVAVEQAQRAKRQRRAERRRRRRVVLRRMVPRLPDRRTGRLFARRSRRQRGAITGGVFVALLLVWWYADTLSTKIALTIFIAAATPVLVVVALDRRI